MLIDTQYECLRMIEEDSDQAVLTMKAGLDCGQVENAAFPGQATLTGLAVLEDKMKAFEKLNMTLYRGKLPHLYAHGLGTNVAGNEAAVSQVEHAEGQSQPGSAAQSQQNSTSGHSPRRRLLNEKHRLLQAVAAQGSAQHRSAGPDMLSHTRRLLQSSPATCSLQAQNLQGACPDSCFLDPACSPGAPDGTCSCFRTSSSPQSVAQSSCWHHLGSLTCCRRRLAQSHPPYLFTANAKLKQLMCLGVGQGRDPPGVLA